jgi:hypothetical protein
MYQGEVLNVAPGISPVSPRSRRDSCWFTSLLTCHPLPITRKKLPIYVCRSLPVENRATRSTGFPLAIWPIFGYRQSGLQPASSFQRNGMIGPRASERSQFGMQRRIERGPPPTGSVRWPAVREFVALLSKHRQSCRFCRLSRLLHFPSIFCFTSVHGVEAVVASVRDRVTNHLKL